MQRVIFDCRLVAVPELNRWHDRLRRWARRWPTDIAAEPRRVVVDADAGHADGLLERLICKVLELADADGAVLAIGVGVGGESPVRLADGRVARSGTAAEEAQAVADAALPGQVLVSGAARSALDESWAFGGRRVLEVVGGVAAQELLWRDDDHEGRTTSRRVRGTVTRLEADRSAIIAGDDGLAYWAPAGQQLAEAAGPGVVVWFVRAGGATNTRPQAVAMAPVGATLIGTIQRQGEDTLLRASTADGHWMTFVAREGDLMGESAYVGDVCRFRVADGVGGPSALELEREVDVPRPTVISRILAACMSELASFGAGGAAAAVRRSTKAIATDADPVLEEQRLWLGLDHAGGGWVVPALKLLPDGGGPSGRAAAREAVAARDRAGARRLVVTLGELLDGDVVSSEGRDLRPLLRTVRLAANHAAQINPELRPGEVDHVACAATLIGDAMAQALLCGVIGTVPAEAKHLVRRLAAVRGAAPSADGEAENDATGDKGSGDMGQTEPTIAAATGAVQALLDYAREHVLPRLGSDDPYRHAIPVALFARSFSLIEASVLLADAGHGREIVILNRPLFEYMVDAYWAAKDPELAERRFVEQARHSQNVQRQFAKRRLDLFPQAESAQRLDPDEIRRLDKTFGVYGDKSWTGLSLRRRVEEIEPMFGDESTRLRLSHDVHHRLANAELHTTSWSLARSLRRVQRPDGSERLQVRVEPEAELIVIGLQQTWWVFGQLLGLMHRQAGLNFEPLWELSAMGAQALRFVDPKSDQDSALVTRRAHRCGAP